MSKLTPTQKAVIQKMKEGEIAREMFFGNDFMVGDNRVLGVTMIALIKKKLIEPKGNLSDIYQLTPTGQTLDL